MSLKMKYFVLRPSMEDAHGKASLEALITYADKIREYGTKEQNEEFENLGNDIYDWVYSFTTKEL